MATEEEIAGIRASGTGETSAAGQSAREQGTASQDATEDTLRKTVVFDGEDETTGSGEIIGKVTRYEAEETGSQETEETGNQTAEEIGNQTTAETGNQGTEETESQGTEETGSQETGNQTTEETGSQETAETGNQETGSQTTEETGTQETAEAGKKGKNQRKNRTTYYRIRTADGNVVEIKAVNARAADRVTAAAMNFIETSDMDDGTARDLLDVVKDRKVTAENVEAVLKDARNMMIRGHLGMPFPASVSYSPEVAMALYQKGQASAMAAEETRKTGATEKQGTLKPGKGKVEYRGVNPEELQGQQKKQAEAAAEVARRIGYNLIIENDTENRNKFGSYDAATGSVVLNIAGTDRSGSRHHLMVAMSHEVTHLLENNSPETYTQLRDFVFREAMRGGSDLVARVGQKMDNYNYQIGKIRENGLEHEDVTIDGAIAELVADSCDQVLGNEKLIRKMAGENQTLFERVKGAVSDFVGRVREAVKGMRESGSIDSAYIRDMDKLAEKWGIALEEAGNGRISAETGENNQNDAGKNEFSLDEYSKAERDNFEKYGKIVIYDGSEKQLDDFISEGIKKRHEFKKMYFGKVDSSLAERILSDTGVDVKGFNVALGNDEVRKVMVNSHGDPILEGNRGQVPIESQQIKDAIKTINEADTINRDANDYMGNPVIFFKKNINGIETVITYKANKHKELRIQTVYKGVANKKSLTTAGGVQAPLLTSETTRGTAYTDNNTQNENNGNRESGKNSQMSLAAMDNSFSLEDENVRPTDWLMAMDAKDIDMSTKAERALVRNYQQTRNRISEIQEKMAKMREELQTAKGDEARKLRINLQTEQNRLNRAEEKLAGITSGRSFEGMLRQAQESISYLMGMKSQEDVNKAAARMREL